MGSKTTNNNEIMSNKKQYFDRHGNPIDAYTYPEGVSGAALRDYQYAVEVTHQRDGLPVEFFCYDNKWTLDDDPSFRATHLKYRVAAPKIAKGHNPDKLTEEQVGVKDGWRLLERGEIPPRESTRDIVLWSSMVLQWLDKYPAIGNYGCNTYRTKKPAGYFLPKPEPKEDKAMETEQFTLKDSIALEIFINDSLSSKEGENKILNANLWRESAERAYDMADHFIGVMQYQKRLKENK